MIQDLFSIDDVFLKSLQKKNAHNRFDFMSVFEESSLAFRYLLNRFARLRLASLVFASLGFTSLRFFSMRVYCYQLARSLRSRATIRSLFGRSLYFHSLLPVALLRSRSSFQPVTSLRSSALLCLLSAPTAPCLLGGRFLSSSRRPTLSDFPR